MPGSNSEAVYLSSEERIELWVVCSQELKGSGKKLIAGTGVESTSETIRLTQKAAELGAEAALVVPPFFYKNLMTPDTLTAHFKSIADASPIPLFIYNVPAFTGIDFSPTTLLAMAEHPRIIGFKDSSANIVKCASVLAKRPDLQVLAGNGSALLPFLSLGAVGAIAALANFAGGQLVQVYEAFNAGHLEEARRIQLSLADINTAVTSRYGVPGLKYAMDRCGYYGGPSRRPLLPLSANERVDIDQLLEKIQL